MTEHYLSGAKWSLKNNEELYEGLLDENGCADLREIKIGNYTFTLSKEGYQTKTEEVTVDGSPINIKVELKPEPKKKEKKSTSKSRKGTKKESKKEPKKDTKKTTTKKEPKKEPKKSTTKKSTTKKTDNKKEE